MQENERINPLKAKDGLQTKILGDPIHCFRELPSTNDIAKELAAGDAREGTVILSETQTMGRGRLGREWMSPIGGLWVSIILRPKTELEHTPKLALMASIAVAETIRKLFSLKAEIKWPNDVLISHKKVCGILTEAKTKSETLEFAVLGIGINANFSVNTLPIFLGGSATTLKDELKKEIERVSLLRTLLEETESYYDLFTKGRFDVLLTEWRRLAGFLGSYVEILSYGERILGWAVDIDEDGALVVKLEDQTMRKVISGDVTILKMKR